MGWRDGQAGRPAMVLSWLVVLLLPGIHCTIQPYTVLYCHTVYYTLYYTTIHGHRSGTAAGFLKPSPANCKIAQLLATATAG